LLVGEYDEKFRVINCEMDRLCKSAKVNIITNCGHNIHFENVNEFVLNFRKFLLWN
jgi:2-succinyl-6-hydroxy-2,4-cyclohexadiene-1-carboxylate synthase